MLFLRCLKLLDILPFPSSGMFLTRYRAFLSFEITQYFKFPIFFAGRDMCMTAAVFTGMVLKPFDNP